jgi:hypothetical protein
MRSPFHCWPHQQKPSSLMMQVPVPQQRGSSMVGVLKCGASGLTHGACSLRGLQKPDSLWQLYGVISVIPRRRWINFRHSQTGGKEISVIPAQAGIHVCTLNRHAHWIPACAGMTRPRPSRIRVCLLSRHAHWIPACAGMTGLRPSRIRVYLLGRHAHRIRTFGGISVIPAQAGIHVCALNRHTHWIPACAGMTVPRPSR